MRTLVISDLHLTHRFKRRKFAFLSSLIPTVDTVVLNGDFWDGYLTSFDKFINSRWQELFVLLAKKEVFYLYGNHDKEEYSDARRNQFAKNVGISFTFKQGEQEFFFTHGDEIVHMPDKSIPSLRTIKALAKAFECFKVVGVGSLGRHFYRPFTAFNATLREWKQSNLAEETIMCCGHTHCPEASPDVGFFNSGFIEHGWAHYILIENGKPSLRIQRY